MKRAPDEHNLDARLGPSKFAAEGFLGTDTRPVEEIIADDMRALESTGVAKSALVESLRNAYETARDALGAEVSIRPGVYAVFYESMGRIPSPFRGDGVFPKGEAVITHKQTGAHLIITALGINLIREHDFFQGRGSRFRIEPDQATAMLGLRP